MSYCLLCRKRKAYLFCLIDLFTCRICGSCRTLFITPQPDPEDLKKYYRKNFNFGAGLPNEKRIRRKAREVIQTLKDLNPQGNLLLDVGCGYGFFLVEARRLGLSALGIEPSLNLRKYHKSKKIKQIACTTFENLFKRGRGEKYDFIILSHVLEHTSNPALWLKMSEKLLKKRGILYIETPNLNSYLFTAEKYNYTFLTPPEHLWIFSLQSLQSITKKMPRLQIVGSSTYTYPEHFMGILKSFIRKKAPTMVANEKIGSDSAAKSFFKQFKYWLFDKLIANLFYRLLNFENRGSILQIYLKKN